jgi:hypothetical protein
MQQKNLQLLKALAIFKKSSNLTNSLHFGHCCLNNSNSFSTPIKIISLTQIILGDILGERKPYKPRGPV